MPTVRPKTKQGRYLRQYKEKLASYMEQNKLIGVKPTIHLNWYKKQLLAFYMDKALNGIKGRPSGNLDFPVKMNTRKIDLVKEAMMGGLIKKTAKPSKPQVGYY